MPRKFNDNEREYIKKRLKEEAMRCLTLYGIKKTSVDELVKRANIPKGTFYLMYESKEILFFEVINDIHEELEKMMFSRLQVLTGNITTDILTDVLYQVYAEVNKSGLLNVMINGEMDFLMKKLPEKVVKEHMENDNLSMEKLFHFLPLRDEASIEIFSGALRGIFMTLLYKREIGEKIFDDALKLMLRGIVLQMMED